MRKWLCIIILAGMITGFAIAQESTASVFVYDHIDSGNSDEASAALLDAVFNTVQIVIKSDGTYSITNTEGKELNTGSYTVEDAEQGKTKTYHFSNADSGKTTTAILTDGVLTMPDSPVSIGNLSFNCNVYYKIADGSANSDKNNSKAAQEADTKETAPNNDASTAGTPAEHVTAVKDSDTVLFDQNGVRMALTGTAKNSSLWVELGVVIENNSSNRIRVKYGGSVNGWSIGDYNSLLNGPIIEPNTKAKASITVNHDKTEVSEYNDLKDMNLCFTIVNADNGKQIFKTDHIDVVFDHAADQKEDTESLGILNSNGYAAEGERLLIFEKNGIALYLNGDHENGSQWIELPVTVVNNSDKAIKITYSGSVNGWSLSSYSSLLNSPEIEPGTAAKSAITFSYKNTGNLQYSDLESANLKFKVKTETGNSLFSIEADTIYFNVPKSAAKTTLNITYSDQNTIKMVQQALNDIGYNCGKPDGIAGKNTKAAIRKYRAANNLGSSETIDSKLLNSLGIKDQTESGNAVE